jgi:hypothetical protein
MKIKTLEYCAFCFTIEDPGSKSYGLRKVDVAFTAILRDDYLRTKYECKVYLSNLQIGNGIVRGPVSLELAERCFLLAYCDPLNWAGFDAGDPAPSDNLH